VLDTDDQFLADIPGIGTDFAARIKKDATRVVEEEKREQVDAKKAEESRAREQAREMFREAEARQARLPEFERLVRVRGVGESTIPKLEMAGLHSVEDLAGLSELRRSSDLSGMTPEDLDQLRHAAARYLQREQAGEPVEPSNPDAGPEDDYEPSELLTDSEEDEAPSSEAPA